MTSKSESEKAEGVTYSIRLTKKQHELLSALAKHRNTKVAVLSRDFVLEGVRRALDPDEITLRIEEEKAHLLRVAEEMRASVDVDAVGLDSTPSGGSDTG